ncbi:hypothetical protein V3N99_08215 [Dermatophilaceae bacterium Soc4.6]
MVDGQRRLQGQLEHVLNSDIFVEDEHTADDVLREIRDRGVENLEALVTHSLKMYRAEQQNPSRATPMTSSILRRHFKETSDGDVDCTHRPPECELVIDGVNYDPSDITRFDGQPLYMVATSGRDGPLLQTFTNNQVEEALHTRAILSVLDYGPPMGGGGGWMGSVGQAPNALLNPPTLSGTVQMFDDAEWKGDYFWLTSRHWWPDLTKVWKNRFLFTHGDWNDQISSQSPSDDTITYYEHVNAGGSNLILPRYDNSKDVLARKEANFRQYGWNDRASSVANYG